MARVLYTAAPPAPAETPAGPGAIPGGGYERIQSSPADFGALTAQATEKLGTGFERAGTDVFAAYKEQQELYNQTVANDQTNKYQDLTTKLFYGDGTPGNPGFNSLNGEAMMKAAPSVRDQLIQQRESIGAQLNPRAKVEYDNYTRKMQAYMLEGMGRHMDEAQKVYGNATDKAQIDLSAQGAALNYNDDAAFMHSLSDANTAATRQSRRAGAPEGSAVWNDLHLDATSPVVKGRAEALARASPEAALNLIQTFRPQLREEAFTALQTHLRGLQAAAAVDEVMGTGGRGYPGVAPIGPPVAGATQDENKLLNEIRYRESGGDYKAQGPTGDHGAFQFIDATWREATQATGQGGQYTHASDAPPAVQDTNALWLLRAKGTQPWKASGPYEELVAGHNKAAQQARETGQPLPPTMAAGVRADYGTALSRLENKSMDPETKAKAITELHSRFSFEQSLAEKEERDAEHNRIDQQKGVWSKTMADIERGNPPTREQIATMLDSRQIDQTQYASIQSRLSGRGERDDPSTYANLNRKARTGEDVTQDVYEAISHDMLRPQSADTILNLSETKRAQRENQVERAAFASLRTIAGMDATEHPMVDLGQVGNKAQVALWSQAQDEWNRRVNVGREQPMDVLSDMAPRYQHPIESIHGLPRPRVGAISKIDDVGVIAQKTQAAFDAGQLTPDQFRDEQVLIKHYHDVIDAQQKRMEAAKAAAARNAGQSRGRRPEAVPAEMQ